MKLLRAAFAAALMLLAVPALAETFAWTNGTGGPAPDGTRIYCTTAKPYGSTPSVQVLASATTATFALQADVVPLTYACVARHYKGAVESANSNEIQVTVAAVPLPAPTQFRLTINVTTNPDGTADVKIEMQPVNSVVGLKQ